MVTFRFDQSVEVLFVCFAVWATWPCILKRTGPLTQLTLDQPLGCWEGGISGISDDSCALLHLRDAAQAPAPTRFRKLPGAAGWAEPGQTQGAGGWAWLEDFENTLTKSSDQSFKHWILYTSSLDGQREETIDGSLRLVENTSKNGYGKTDAQFEGVLIVNYI